MGIYNLERLPDGRLERKATPLVEQFARHIRDGIGSVGELAPEMIPVPDGDGAYVGQESEDDFLSPVDRPTSQTSTASQQSQSSTTATPQTPSARNIDHCGIVVFSHLRWGFVWQRPQQFLSRFARKHKVLFVEEPFFDLPESAEPRLDFHKVMPNVTVLAPHMPPSYRSNAKLAALLRRLTREGIDALNEGGEFDQPLLWYYSPMDSSWSLGYFPNCGIVYDCMDELSQFTGAPPSLIKNEARLMKYADVVFAGGYELGEKKQKQHNNVHTFGCGVDFAHFSRASDPNTRIPPDIDFMKRPILGWFGVVDERVDYPLIAEMARVHAPRLVFRHLVGPVVVKVDPNLLPHAPNLFWLGQTRLPAASELLPRV